MPLAASFFLAIVQNWKEALSLLRSKGINKLDVDVCIQ